MQKKPRELIKDGEYWGWRIFLRQDMNMRYYAIYEVKNESGCRFRTKAPRTHYKALDKAVLEIQRFEDKGIFAADIKSTVYNEKVNKELDERGKIDTIGHAVFELHHGSYIAVSSLNSELARIGEERPTVAAALKVLESQSDPA